MALRNGKDWGSSGRLPNDLSIDMNEFWYQAFHEDLGLPCGLGDRILRAKVPLLGALAYALPAATPLYGSGIAANKISLRPSKRASRPCWMSKEYAYFLILAIS